MFHHGATKANADTAIHDYQNWAKRVGGVVLTEQDSIIDYKDWLIND